MINLTRKDKDLYRKQLKKQTTPQLDQMLNDLFTANRNVSLHMRIDGVRKAWAIEEILRERGLS